MGFDDVTNIFHIPVYKNKWYPYALFPQCVFIRLCGLCRYNVVIIVCILTMLENSPSFSIHTVITRAALSTLEIPSMLHTPE